MIKFTCSDCGFALEAEETEAGKLVRCKSCESLIAVPQSQGEGGMDAAVAAALSTISEAPKLEKTVTVARGMAVLIGGGALLLTGVAIFCSIMGKAASDDNTPPEPPPAVQANPHVSATTAPAPTTAPTASTDPGR